MRKIVLLLAVAFIGFSSSAQVTIANGGMETWTGSGSTLEPTNWNSNKTGGGNASSGPQTCFRDVAPHSGTYCAKVVSGSTFGIVVNGSLTTGKVEAPSFSKSEGYIQTVPTDANYAMSFVGRPDSLVFWYKFTKQGSDYPKLEARLHVSNATAPEAPVNSNHPNYSANIIARAQWNGAAASVGSWTRVSMPFVYVDGRTPQFILITSTSSGDQNGGTSGSTLWIDDVEAIYTAITGTINPTTYYVSSTVGASVTVPFTLRHLLGSTNVVTAQLSDANGSFASPTNIGTVTTNVSGSINATIPANTATGTGYRIRVVCDVPNVIGTDNGANLTIYNVSNSITPSTSQSIVVNTNGNLLTVNETPAGTARVWKYATTSGGPYTLFSPSQTGTTYTPNFNTSGSYFIICESTIGGLTATSNEVEVNVGSLTLNTGTISPLVYNFSASAPNASVNVPYTVVGAFQAGNIFTAQLSDATGSFASPVAIGTLASTTSGTIVASIPKTTASGTGYRIRVIGSNPAINGADNGADITINQFANAATPTTAQNIYLNTNGTAISVSATQTATHEWKYTTTSGTGYQSFSPIQTNTTYTPNFSTVGTYYVVAVSKNQLNDEVISAETQVNVSTGLNTGAVAQLLYQFSPSAPDAVFYVPFTVLGNLNAGNQFTAQLSDANGSFAAPVTIGTKAGVATDSIQVTIAHTQAAGNAYRIRVVSSSPSLIGNDNGLDIKIDQYNTAITPIDTQRLLVNVSGNVLSVAESQASSREWKYTTTSGSGYQSFSPARTSATYRPNFSAVGTYYVIAQSKNQYNDVLNSNEVVVIVRDTTTGINDLNSSTIQIYQSQSNLVIQTSNNTEDLSFELFDITGKAVISKVAITNDKTSIPANLPQGIYVFRLSNTSTSYTGKIRMQ